MEIQNFTLPTINASLNSLSIIFLLLGFFAIKKGNQLAHRKHMTAALLSSVLFLTMYLIYHYQVGSVKYPFFDWTRPLYYIILIPHVILAALMTPFIVFIVMKAYQQDFQKHKKLARYVWPVWMFVSVSGVMVYLLLYGRVYLS